MLELDRREGEIKQFGILRSKSEWEGKRSDQLSCGPLIAFEGRNWASMDKKRSPIMNPHRPSDGPPSRFPPPAALCCPPEAGGGSSVGAGGAQAPLPPETPWKVEARRSEKKEKEMREEEERGAGGRRKEMSPPKSKSWIRH